MKLANKLAPYLAAIALGAAVSSAPVMAAENTQFSALQGVEAQTLSVEEMQAISGELNAYDVAAFLFAQAERYAKFPRLAEALTNLANYTLTNAERINAAFARLGILTPCMSSLCPKP